jgi:uncharacterized protein YggE
LDFRIRNTEKLRKEALTAAIRDARNKADIIAQGLGCHIVGIKNVSESTDYIEARSYDRNMLLASKAAATNIEPGTLDFNARVHIEYLLSK